MGNCWSRCFGRLNKRKYLRTRYNVARDLSIEFETLMDEEAQSQDNPKAVLPHEKTLLLNRRYNELVQFQKSVDLELDEKLVRQEEELRIEEEAYYEAKREAARAAKMQRQHELKGSSAAETSTWITDDDEWNIAGGDDDFEMFLESVKARSLPARSHSLPSQVPADTYSSSSSGLTKEDQSHRTEASSIDLEWDHEAGTQPLAHISKPRGVTSTQPPLAEMTELAVKAILANGNSIAEQVVDAKQPASSDFLWDSDFESNASQSGGAMRTSVDFLEQ